MKNAIIYILLILLGCSCIYVWANRGREASHSPVETTTAEIWRITAYCPCEKCCGEFADGITASGVKAEGLIIAAPKEISFGTWIEVEGYGYAEVLDRGGIIKGKRLDVFFPTHQEALNWGVKYLEIEL